MSPTLEGQLDQAPVRIGIVVSRFNEFVTDKLLRGAEECLERHGCSADRRTVVRVPGAWEVPQAARRLIATGRYDAVVALGALIRGDTPHFDVLAAEVARSLGQLAQESGVPTIFGVLTTNNVEQALERAGPASDNKGFEAAQAALEMADLFRRLDGVS